MALAPISVTGDSAIFNGTISGTGTINATNTNITFVGSLRIYNYTSTSSINNFQSDVTFVAGGSFSGSADSSLYFSGGTFTNDGAFSNSGSLTSSSPTTNSGIFIQSGAQNWSPATTFTNTAGTAIFESDAGSESAYNLVVNVTGGTVALTSQQHWAGLTISGDGIVNVENAHIIFTYGSTDPISDIRGYLISGYAGGAWNGPGIGSSIAALNSHYGVGYADGADGVVSVLSSGQIEITYTLYGDANLDGVVNGTDFGILAANFGQQVSGWDQGDFNYDGVVNGRDFGLLAANFGQQANGAVVELPSSDWAALDSFAAANGLIADVPEPAAFGLIVLAGIGAIGQRRRRPGIISRF